MARGRVSVCSIGPADAVTEKWRLLRDRWNSDDNRVVGDVIEAAYAVPALRQLFPFTSHATLCFSTCTGYPYSGGLPHVSPLDGGGYLVDSPTGVIIGQVDDAEGAVALVVTHLPANLGPTVAGSADGA